MREIKITREPDDPLALRASVGGRPEIGWYLVYRGDPDVIVEMLREVLAAAEEHAASQPSRRQG